MANNTLDTLFRALSQLLVNLRDNTTSPRAITTLVNEIGFEMPPGGSDFGLAAIDLATLLAKAKAVLDLEAKIDAGEGGLSLQLDAAYVDLIPVVASTLAALKNLPAALAALPPAYLGATNIETVFVPRVLSALVSRYLQDTRVPAYQLLRFSGLMQQIVEAPNAATFRAGNTHDELRIDRLPKLFTDFASVAQEQFGWASATFDPGELLGRIGELLQSIGGTVNVHQLSQKEEELLTGAPAPLTLTQPLTGLIVSLIQALGGIPASAGFLIAPLRPTTPGGTDWGIGISPILDAGASSSFTLAPNINATIDSSADLNAGIAALIRPTGGTLRTNLRGGPNSAASGHLLLTLAYAGGAQPLDILTIAPGIGVSAQQIALSGGADIDGGRLGAIVKICLTGGRFRLDSSQMDSFLSSIIPVSIDLDFNFGIGWSTANGFFFQGNASPALTLPLHDQIGPFDIETLHLGLDLQQGNTLPFEISVTGGASIGPFSVSVDRIGIQAVLTASDGNLGPVDLSLQFKPPNGLGMTLDAGLISGGGYLWIDTAKHRYAGLLQCSIADIVQVQIIGVLDTVLPGGSNGFSLLLVIITEFPPVQLSFGFTLNGVGGVGGINRTMAIDALRAGLRAHQLNSVLFPNDPINNAPQIISNLESFFPPAADRYLFGPMFELGWGTPTLITLSLGVILEIPDPIRLAILGEIKAALPDQDVGLIALNIDVLGTVDFGTKLFMIDGTMYDSYVLVYSISGDLGLRLSWGDNPNFAFSLGGLNPRFQPPPDFPKLARCTVSIGDGDNPRLSSICYFAVTSNSVQFGANVDLYAAAGGFSVHGWIGYDCLFMFEPFSFEFDFSAGLDIEYDGDSIASLTVDGLVAGPRPWHVHGDAHLHILFIDVSAGVDLHWGDSTPATLPKISVLNDLLPALADPRNWSTQMPAEAAPGVSLAPPSPGDKSLVVHPLGTLQVREKVVPLDQVITKYGNARPSDGSMFAISDVVIGTTHPTLAPICEQFAIGQFTDLSNDQKLSSPSYQLMHGGISIGSDTAVYSKDVPCIVAYQDGYLDDDDLPLRLGSWFLMPLTTHLAYARNGANFVNATRTKGVRAFTAPGTSSTVTVAEMQYVVASAMDLSVRSDILAAPATQHGAASMLAAYRAANPADGADLQILPLCELAA
jgi:hypothetical protein